MACYLGCRGCCAKLRWLIFIIAILAAVACLVAGLIKTVPELTVLFKCTTKEKALQESGEWRAAARERATKEEALQESGECWRTFWAAAGVPFVVSCIGLGALLLALLTCCCFCCASAPGSKKKAQFQSGDGGYDTGAHGDQYAYNAPGPAKV